MVELVHTYNFIVKNVSHEFSLNFVSDHLIFVFLESIIIEQNIIKVF